MKHRNNVARKRKRRNGSFANSDDSSSDSSGNCPTNNYIEKNVPSLAVSHIAVPLCHKCGLGDDKTTLLTFTSSHTANRSIHVHIHCVTPSSSATIGNGDQFNPSHEFQVVSESYVRKSRLYRNYERFGPVNLNEVLRMCRCASFDKGCGRFESYYLLCDVRAHLHAALTTHAPPPLLPVPGVSTVTPFPQQSTVSNNQAKSSPAIHIGGASLPLPSLPALNAYLPHNASNGARNPTASMRACSSMTHSQIMDPSPLSASLRMVNSLLRQTSTARQQSKLALQRMGPSCH